MKSRRKVGQKKKKRNKENKKKGSKTKGKSGQIRSSNYLNFLFSVM